MDEVRQSAGHCLGAFQGCVQFARSYNEIAKHAEPLLAQTRLMWTVDENKLRSPNDMIEPDQRALFDTIYMQVLNLLGQLEGVTADKIGELNHLHEAIRANFRGLFFDIPSSEKAVQDNFERFLLARGFKKPANFDRETGRVKVAGKEFVPDFILGPLNCAVEIKLLAERASIKAVIEELNADIAAYSTKYEAVIALIYDLGQIRDVDEFESGLKLVGYTRVVIVKH